MASLAERPIEATIDLYVPAALAEPTTRGKQVNVLEHILGFLPRVLTAFEKRELLTLIDDYRSGRHGLDVPLVLLLHHLHKHALGGRLATQRHFHPYPRDLAA